MHFQLRFLIENLLGFWTASLEIDGNTIAAGAITLRMRNKLIYTGILKRDDARKLCIVAVAALRTYGKDAAWNRTGLDGFVTSGSFQSRYCAQRKFACWCPEPGTLPHNLISTAVECVPINHDNPYVEFDVEKLRELFGKGEPVRLINSVPPKLRIIGIVHSTQQIAEVLSKIPENSDLIVDIENTRVHSSVRAALLPLTQRAQPVQWILHGRDLKWLRETGVNNTSILNLDAATREAEKIEHETVERTRKRLDRHQKAQAAAARIAESGIICPRCRKHTNRIRFVDRGLEAKSFFICRLCNRSFTEDELH